MEYCIPKLINRNVVKMACAVGSAAGGNSVTGISCGNGLGNTSGTAKGSCTAGLTNSADAGCATGNQDAQDYYTGCTTGAAQSASASSCDTGTGPLT